MSVLKMVRCPACGKKKLLRSPCPCGGKVRARSRTRGAGWTAFLLTLVGTTATLVIVAAMINSAGHPLAAILVVASVFGLLSLFRLGYDFEDGIDIQNFLLPSPMDWGEKWASMFNFMEMDRPYFKAIYIGSLLALMISGVIFLSGRS